MASLIVTTFTVYPVESTAVLIGIAGVLSWLALFYWNHRPGPSIERLLHQAYYNNLISMESAVNEARQNRMFSPGSGITRYGNPFGR